MPTAEIIPTIVRSKEGFPVTGIGGVVGDAVIDVATFVVGVGVFVAVGFVVVAVTFFVGVGVLVACGFGVAVGVFVAFADGETDGSTN